MDYEKKYEEALERARNLHKDAIDMGAKDVIKICEIIFQELAESKVDKSDIVAEIDRLQDSIKATAVDGRISKEQAEAYRICVKLRSFVEDTLKT